MIDLIQWGRNGGEGSGKHVRVFETVEELRDYCQETKKIFINNLDEDSEHGGVVLRHLLRRIFNPNERIYSDLRKWASMDSRAL